MAKMNKAMEDWCNENGEDWIFNEQQRKYEDENNKDGEKENDCTYNDNNNGDNIRRKVCLKVS